MNEYTLPPSDIFTGLPPRCSAPYISSHTCPFPSMHLFRVERSQKSSVALRSLISFSDPLLNPSVLMINVSYFIHLSKRKQLNQDLFRTLDDILWVTWQAGQAGQAGQAWIRHT